MDILKEKLKHNLQFCTSMHMRTCVPDASIKGKDK